MASRGTVIALILAATVLFVLGILLEKNSGEHHSESVAQASETPAEHAAESSGSSEGAPTESQRNTSAESPKHAAESEGEIHNESDEKVLGINYESTPLVILAVIVSLGMAAAVGLARAPWVFLLVAAAMIGFAVFDIAEVFHQIDRSEGGIAALAGLVAVLHLGAGLGSAQLRRQHAS
jgi:hypothetical protein